MGQDTTDYRDVNYREADYREVDAALHDSEARFRRLAQQEALINCISSQIRQSLDLDTILQTAVAEIRKLLRVDRCQFVQCQIYDGLVHYRVLKEATDPSALSHLDVHHCFQTEGFIDQVFTQPVINWADSHLLPNAETRQFFMQMGYRAVLGLAVQPRSCEFGFISCSNHEVRYWSDEEARLLCAVTDQLAIAINQAKLYAESRQQAEREALLRRVTNQIRSTLDSNQILQTAVSEVRQLLQTDRVVVYQFLGPDWQGSVVVEDVQPPWISVMGNAGEDNCFTEGYAEQYRSGRVRAINNILTAGLDDCHIRFLQRLQVQANLIVPIITGTTLWGLLVAHECRAPRQWQTWEALFLEQLADQLAITIQQAELYSQVQQAAAQSQTQAATLKAAVEELRSAQTQLIQSEKMSSLGQMVAGIAHEINNPVSFIYGNVSYATQHANGLLELLKLYQQDYPEPTAAIQAKIEEIDLEFVEQDLPKLLNSMRVGSDRISEIVRSLRVFSRLDEAEKKRVDIHEGLESTLTILEHRLKATPAHSAIQVIRNYAPLPLVECYAGQLNQVFMNLLTNAIDALEDQNSSQASASRPSQPAFIQIQTELSDINRIVIRIRDNGPGIPQDIQQRVFDPFFTTKPVGKGTGLGLAMSYQIVVKNHGGQLTCCSTVGQGAEFVIELPL